MRKLSIALICCSIVLIFPGVLKPIFSLSLEATINSSFANFAMNVLSQERSILGTVQDLWQRNRYLVAGLIFFFSVVIPFIKSVVLLILLAKPNLSSRRLWETSLNLISKWSMADVFTVGILLAFMATTDSIISTKTQVSLMGMNLPVEVAMISNSDLGQGFYFFTAYCIGSIAAFQCFRLWQNQES